MSPLPYALLTAPHEREVPFGLHLEPATEGRRLLDRVVDLAFGPDFAEGRVAHHEQLRRYGHAWARLTGQPVRDRLIIWSRDGVPERVP